MEYGNAEVEIEHSTGRPVNKFDCRYEGLWVVGKTRARGLHTNLSHRRDDRAAASVVTGLSYTTNGKSRQYPRLYGLPINEKNRGGRMKQERVDERIDYQKRRTLLHYKARKHFRQKRHYAKKAIARQIENLEEQKAGMEAELAQRELVMKRRLRDQELREAQWGGGGGEGAKDFIDDADKMVRVQRRISAAGVLEGVEKEQVDALLGD